MASLHGITLNNRKRGRGCGDRGRRGRGDRGSEDRERRGREDRGSRDTGMPGREDRGSGDRERRGRGDKGSGYSGRRGRGEIGSGDRGRRGSGDGGRRGRERERRLDRGCETYRGGHRVNSGRPIGYGLLKAWNELDDTDNLLVRMAASKDLLTQLLNDKCLKDDCIHEILKIFTKICRAERSENKVAMLVLLRSSDYMKTCIRESMVMWGVSEPTRKIRSIATSMLLIVDVCFKLFPTSCMDMPLNDLATFIKENLPLDMELIAEVEKLFLDRKGLLKKKLTPSIKKLHAQFTNEPPPNDFRNIPTVPDVNDIYREDRPYLRPIKLQGGYSNGEEYLDVQFRLLREDFVSPLRAGILEIVGNVPWRDRKHALSVFNQVRVLYPLCTKSGIIHRVKFNDTHTKDIQWQHSKRLILRSLVCLSKDQFKTVIFATVANRSPEDLRKGFVDLRFAEGIKAENYFQNGVVLSMVENSAFFEAYKHVLDALKEFDANDVPMRRYIVDCQADVCAPAYLSIDSHEYDLTTSLNNKQLKDVDMLDRNTWPTCQETNLNKSQLDAFMYALTKEFAVIQGPPGTGKTHVGTRIADALLKNKKVWDKNEKTPMLIVCYTNHALDQFLKGIIAFGHRNVIRVGSRVSDEMSAYSLRNKEKVRDDFVYHRRAKAQAMEERDNLIKELETVLTVMKLYDSGNFVHYNKLQYVMKDDHKKSFEKFDKKCREFEMSVFCIFLQIIKVPQNRISSLTLGKKEVKRGDNNTNVSARSKDELLQEVDDRVNVEGEGEALVDRWVTDAQKYAVVDHTDKEEEDEKRKKDEILVDKDGFKYVQPSRYERKVRIRHLLREHDAMEYDEAHAVRDPWCLSNTNRCRLYNFWLRTLYEKMKENYSTEVDQLEHVCERIHELEQLEDEITMRKADVVGMTTTCAARYQRIFQKIKPKVVLVEEAAEVLEAHVMTSLNHGVEHLILIGDHLQLKPSPAVFELATRYGLEVSLFQRMVDNGMECPTLDIQHRMRPEISILLRHIYPNLKDHECVQSHPNVKGVSQNVMFINHHQKENQVTSTKSKANKHEAEYMKRLCLYFLQQDYQPDQITILTGYAGQLIQLKNIMPKSMFEGVKVTSVDNFQGEENDIILLSLVRSNEEGKIGFLKTDNRVCVALSRAKHGLYVCGNFDILQQKSPLWEKIIADAKSYGHYAGSLELFCQNHPSTRISAAQGDDFLRAPEGGCIRPCEFRLICGHVCGKACHPIDPKHLEYVCKKTCSKITCKFDHRCEKQCHFGKECGPCITQVEKLIEKCGHTQTMCCKDDPMQFSCNSECERYLECGHRCTLKCHMDCECFVKVKKQLPCGHVQWECCSADIQSVKCTTPCGEELPCGHICSGTCGSCKQKRLHRKCIQKCGRTLVCSHECKEPCTKNCPPCLLPCQNRCKHSKCMQKCGELCWECAEKCEWRCKHSRCTKLCSELCDRQPCGKACRKPLKKCGHSCIGLCGEICPALCRKCDKKKVQEIFFGDEDEPTARFIVLEDCNHFFEVKGLDRWMKQGNGDGSNVKMKECPRCKTIIRRSFRYGNIVKKTLEDINLIKEKINRKNENISSLIEKAYQICRNVNTLMLNVLKHERPQSSFQVDKALVVKATSVKYQKCNSKREGGENNNASILAKRLVERSVGYEAINTILHQAKLLEGLWNLKKDMIKKPCLKDNAWCILEKDFIDLEAFIMNKKMSQQQLQDANEELERNQMFVNIISCKSQLEERRKNWISDAKRPTLTLTKLSQIEEEMIKGSKMKLSRLEEIEKLLEEIKKIYGLYGLTDQERIMIVDAIGLGKGHWYKCPKGHYYAIGECGGATENAQCPDCGAVVGGINHTLAAGNQHAGEFDGSAYAAYSEEANNVGNWDQEDLRRLQLQ